MSDKIFEYKTLLKKYTGRWIAIVNGEVAAVGEKNTEVMLESFRKTCCKVMYLNKVGHEKTALRKRIRQYTTPSYDEDSVGFALYLKAFGYCW